MPSVFTIEGAPVATRKPRKARKAKSKSKAFNGNPQIGDCQTVKNPRTGCSMQLCYVGKSRSKTGWKFQKGSSSCAVKRR